MIELKVCACPGRDAANDIKLEHKKPRGNSKQHCYIYISASKRSIIDRVTRFATVESIGPNMTEDSDTIYDIQVSVDNLDI